MASYSAHAPQPQAERPTVKRGRPGQGGDEDVENRAWHANTTTPAAGATGAKPRLPSCLVGAAPEIVATALGNHGGNGGGRAGGGSAGSGSGGGGALAVETDAHRLAQRQKQIDYGKNTLGYDRYLQLVPKEHRRRTDPRTPDIHAKMSTKRFNGLVRAWRRRLHEYDPPEAEASSATGGAAHPSPAVAALFSPGPTTGGRGSAPGTAARPHAARTPVSHAKTDRADDDEFEDGADFGEEEGGYGGDGAGLEEAGAMGVAGAGVEDDGPSFKKSRVGGGVAAAYADEEGGAMEEASPLPSVDGDADMAAAAGSPGQDTDGDEEEMDCGFEIKRNAAAAVGGAGAWGAAQQAAVDEDVCYSDDDLL